MAARSFDLRFRLGGIPVTVQPWFWLSALVLGGAIRGPMLVFWVGVVFVSVLAHEMGHALAARAFGVGSSVQLHAFGGHTRPMYRLSRARDIAMTLAGPGAGFVVGAMAFTLQAVVGPVSGILGWTVDQLVRVNIGWGVLNLLPVPPLDGGHVLMALAGPRHQRTAQIVGAGLGALLAVGALVEGQIYLAVLFGLLTWQNVQALRTATA